MVTVSLCCIYSHNNKKYLNKAIEIQRKLWLTMEIVPYITAYEVHQ